LAKGRELEGHTEAGGGRTACALARGGPPGPRAREWASSTEVVAAVARLHDVAGRATASAAAASLRRLRNVGYVQTRRPLVSRRLGMASVGRRLSDGSPSASHGMNLLRAPGVFDP